MCVPISIITVNSICLHQGFVIVPQQSALIIERFGKFLQVLESGFHFLVPFVDQCTYIHSLKEMPIMIEHQAAVTKDNVTLLLDGVLYVRVVDPKKASYGVERPLYAISQLAQTTMRSELGKLTLDRTFQEREVLNHRIVAAINAATKDTWGLECLRYEIRDMTPPAAVRQAMDAQAEAERHKRAHILDSEGRQQSDVNIAMGQKRAQILHAEGEAQAILARAGKTAESIELLTNSLKKSGSAEAMAFRIAEQYVQALSGLARPSTTLLLPAPFGDAAAMTSNALSLMYRIAPTEVNSTPTAPRALTNASSSTEIRPENSIKHLHEPFLNPAGSGSARSQSASMDSVALMAALGASRQQLTPIGDIEMDDLDKQYFGTK